MDCESFPKYLTRLFSDGMVMMAMGLGHKLGFFKLLCETAEPLTLKYITEQLGLKERYAKEWLSCMVSAEIVHFDRDTECYYIPEAFKSELKVRSSYAPVLMQLSDRHRAVENCFRKEGPYGVSYEETPGFFDWLNDYRDHVCDRAMEAEIIPRFTEQGLAAKLESGIRVLDIGCGTGSFTFALAKYFPNSTFIGMEFSERALELARAKKEEMKVDNAFFEYGDAHALAEKWTDFFDLVFLYDTLHDLPDPHKCLDEVYRVLKADGIMSLVEMAMASDPLDNRGDRVAAWYYTMSMFVCLQSSMSCEPHVGYGACWGMEEIEKTLVAHKFQINDSSRLGAVKGKVFYYCTK